MKSNIPYVSIRIVITAACLLAAALLFNVTEISKVAIAMIVLATSPWIALFVSEMTVMGNSIKFKVEENSRDIDTLKLLVRAVLTDVELEVIARLRDGLDYEVDTGDSALYPGMKIGLERLFGLGYLKDRSDKMGFKQFEDPDRMKRDLQKYFVVTERGREFLAQFEKAQGKPIDLDELDEATWIRIKQG